MRWRADGTGQGRPYLVALPIMLGLPIVGGCVAFGARAFGERASGAAAFATLAVVVFVGFAFLTRRREPRAGAIGAGASLVWSAVLALGASRALQLPTIDADAGMRCGTGETMFWLFAGPLGAIALLAAGLGVGAAFARRGFDGIVRKASFVATALAVIAVVFAVGKVGRPEPDAYLSSLPIVVQLNGVGAGTVGGRAVTYVRGADVPSPTGGSGIDDGTRGPSTTPPEERIEECRISGIETQRSVGWAQGPNRPCPPARIRWDSAEDLAFVESDVYAGYGGSLWSPHIAFRPSTGMSVEFRPPFVHERLSPPVGWIGGATLGALAALGFIQLARRSRRLAASLAGEDGFHLGDGLVKLGSASPTSVVAPIRVPVVASLPVGPVLLFGGQKHAPTYRDAGTPTFDRATPGSLEQARRAHTDVAASFSAMALSSALLGATPLVVSRLFGI